MKIDKLLLKTNVIVYRLQVHTKFSSSIPKYTVNSDSLPNYMFIFATPKFTIAPIFALLLLFYFAFSQQSPPNQKVFIRMYSKENFLFWCAIRS